MNILKNNISKMLITTIFLFLFLITISSANAAEHNITNTTDGGLNRSVVDASNGDTINLDNGVYTNNVTNITINKNLTIQGKDPATTIIDAQNIGRIFNITPGNTLILINITLTNGQAPEAALFANMGGAIYINGGILTMTNCIVSNNNATNGGAIFNNNSNINLENCNFINNTADNGGGAIFNNFGNLTIINSIFNNNRAIYSAISNFRSNVITINSSFINNAVVNGGAMFNEFSNLTVINSDFINNTAEDAGGAINNDQNSRLNVTNSNFINNTASFGGAIFDLGINTNITNSNFINNTATVVASGIYSEGDNLDVNQSNFTNNNGAAIFIVGINTRITSSNIYNNTQGILINSFAQNTVINYNRIFNNTNVTGFDLDNNGVNTNANLNWWGDNNPLVSGITLGNYFVMNVTNLTSTVTNGSARFNYTFGLNTGESSDPSLLPYFVTNVYTNVTTGIQQTFDARFNRTVTVNTDVSGQNVTYTFITDNEVKNITLFVEPTPTNLEVNSPSGRDGDTVDLIARLTDANGNPIPGKLITFHVGSTTLIAITNVNGIATVQYTIDADDFTDGQLTFTATFEGDDNFLVSSDTGIITLIEEPEPPIPPEPQPEPEELEEANENNELAKAEMKETGTPIIAILIVLLSSLGLVYRKK